MTHMIATPSTCPRTVPLLGTGSALQPIRAKQCLLRAVAQALICLILVNCTTDSRVLSAAEGPDTTAAGAAAAAKPAAPLETWDIYSHARQAVGYVHTTIRNVEVGPERGSHRKRKPPVFQSRRTGRPGGIRR